MPVDKRSSSLTCKKKSPVAGAPNISSILILLNKLTCGGMFAEDAFSLRSKVQRRGEYPGVLLYVLPVGVNGVPYGRLNGFGAHQHHIHIGWEGKFFHLGHIKCFLSKGTFITN